MTQYVCHISVFSTGERFPVLLYKDTYQPVLLSTRYVVDDRRENKQAGTISQDIRVLRWFYEWCDLQEICLETRLRHGKMFSKAEITSLARHLRASRNLQLVGSIGEQNQVKNRSYVISPQTFNAYMGVIQSFLLWAAYEFIPVATPENTVYETVETAVNRINRAFRSNRKNGHQAADRHGLTREEIEEIRQFIKPGSERNPFKKSVQFRNYLIFELMLATGIRRGELLKIQLKHLPYGAKIKLCVVRAPDDTHDPRRNEPQVKTRTREIPLPKRLAVDLWRYVQKYRKAGSNGNAYLFTSGRDGLPLSLGGVNWIFSFLVKKCLPHLKGRLSPHTMRHTYNEMIVKTAQSLGWDEKKIEDFQRYLNGWSEGSEMPTRYTRRLMEAQAMKVAERFQEELYVF